MKKIRNILCCAAACLLASCNLLNVENPSAIYGSGYWSTTGEVSSYLTGTYTLFRSAFNSLEYFEARGDGFIGGAEGSGSNQWAQNLTSLNGLSWADYYSVIQHCNMIIYNIDKVTYTKLEDKDDVLAQVYAMRAYTYFFLARAWGDACIETEPTVGSAKPLPSRSPKLEVVNRAIADAELAVFFFSDDKWIGNKSLASKLGTYALLADIYLWRAKVLGGGDADLKECIKYADLAMAGTSLEEDVRNIYNVGNRNGKEVIWSIHFGYPEITDHYGKFMTLRDVFVEKAANKDQIPYAKSGSRSSYYPSDIAREKFSAYKGDARKACAYIDAVDANGVYTGFTSQNKMVGTKTETNVIYDDDIILYRHAEMILFKAEAYAAMGETTKAVEQLDIIRARAGLGKYDGATDKKSVELEILDERFREFWLENRRWPDLVRFHHEGVIDIYETVPNLKARKEAGIVVPLYYAIPLAELSLNHNLVQTEGYED
ncbi:MAG: RagB/SusD family nutrient uptake outer membrane protein [Bacteroidales bacterium]|nr:RagB/SusD family nutrient uptake outer membrane protein [Bacteroidales bacterium]